MKFKEALNQMIVDGEFEKIIKNSKGKDKKTAKEFYDLIKNNKDFDNISGITLLMAIHSKSVLKDIITYMEMNIENKAENQKIDK